MTQKEEVQTSINPKIIGEIELPQRDYKQYDGAVSIIKSFDIMKNEQFGYYVKLTSEFLDEERTIYATKNLGLFEQRDEKTQEVIGLGWGENTKTGLFLKKHSSKNFEELIGAKIVIRYEVGKEGKEFLTF